MSVRWYLLPVALSLAVLLGCSDSTERIETLEAQVESLLDQTRQQTQRISGLVQENQRLNEQLVAKPAVVEVTTETVRVEVQEVLQPVEFLVLAEHSFMSNKYQLTTQGEKRIQEIARTVKQRYGDRRIVVEGHTDNVPIRLGPDVGAENVKPADNWELSALRAIAVREALEKNGVSPDTLSIAAFADRKPVASNDSEDGRRRNRRVVVVVQPREDQIVLSREATETDPSGDPSQESTVNP